MCIHIYIYIYVYTYVHKLFAKLDYNLEVIHKHTANESSSPAATVKKHNVLCLIIVFIVKHLFLVERSTDQQSEHGS